MTLVIFGVLFGVLPLLFEACLVIGATLVLLRGYPLPASAALVWGLGQPFVVAPWFFAYAALDRYDAPPENTALLALVYAALTSLLLPFLLYAALGDRAPPEEEP